METNIVGSDWKRRFFTIWIGQAFSILGSGLVQFALVWYLTESTGSATILATATFFAIIPEIVLGPFAGALVDRWNRKRVMIVADASIALATLGLGILFWTGVIQTWHIFVILFLRSLGGSFHFPAMQASTSLLVPQEQLSRVAGMNQTIRGLISIAAPALGAFLMGMMPIYFILALDVVTATIAITPLFFFHIPQPNRTLIEPTTPRTVIKDVVEGLRYVKAWPGMLLLLGCAALINFLFTPVDSLMPLLVTKHFNGDAIQLGLLSSTFGVGAVIGGLVLSVWGGFKRKIYTTMLGLVGMGVGVIVMGAAPSSLFYMALAGAVVCGFMGPIVNGPIFAIVQSNVDPSVQGRVMALISTFCMAMMPIGTMIAGPVSDLLGIRVWYFIAGGGILLMGLSGFVIPSLRKLEDHKTEVAAVSADVQPAAIETPAD